jgi:hypothetical protein
VASVKEMQAELEKLRMELQMLKKGPALLQ